MFEIETIKSLTKELLGYCHEYYDLDAPTISDAEYDKKYDKLKNLEDSVGFWLANSPTRKVQGNVLPYLVEVKHSTPMLSANKTTNKEDVKKFIGKELVVASYKLDGCSIVLRYNDGSFFQGISRGNGRVGEDITHTVKTIKNLPLTIPYKGYLEVRGEAVIPWSYYNEMNKDNALGHPRNVVSGALRQLDPKEAASKNIYFYAFTLVNWKDVGVVTKAASLNFLFENGFDTVPYFVFYQNDELSTVDDVMVSLDRKSYGIPTDGWCFEYNELKYGEALGSTNHHDKKLLALKPQINEHITYFRDIIYNTCRTGMVSLTAEFDPIEIDNTTISRATLHNVDYFNKLELGYGDEIVVAKMNEIIPGIVRNNTRSGTFELIKKCPSCGQDLVIKNAGSANFLYCGNEDCPSRKLAKFVHFVDRECMNIKGLSEKTLYNLICHGLVANFMDIFSLSQHTDKLILLDGCGKKSAENIVNSIENARTVKLENFINALSIPSIGLVAAKSISKYFNGNFEEFYSAAQNNFDFTLINDFGKSMNKSFYDWWKDNAEMVLKLSKELNFVVAASKLVGHDLEGIKFTITGTFSIPRNEIKQELENRGAVFMTYVSKNLDVIFAGKNAGGKIQKAQQFGIKIFNENQLMNLLKTENVESLLDSAT